MTDEELDELWDAAHQALAAAPQPRFYYVDVKVTPDMAEELWGPYCYPWCLAYEWAYTAD